MSTAKPVKNVEQVILCVDFVSILNTPMVASSLVDGFFSSAILPIYRTMQSLLCKHMQKPQKSKEFQIVKLY